MRVKLTIAYDGTAYCGWQIQPNGITVQEEINRALSELFSAEIHCIGASRTDAGVHALGNVAAFDVETKMPAEKIAYALNARLPRDIVIQKSEEAAADFHPRFDAKRKTYEYHILNRNFSNPLLRQQTYFFHRKLNVDAMQKAAGFLVGEHDFTSFSSIHAQTNSFVRTIYTVSVQKDEQDVITVHIEGNGFLYNMVRIIVGTLVQVGCGKLRPEQVKDILEAKNRSLAGPTAPPEGLVLVGIEY